MLNGPIGIIGAMDSEVRYLIGCLKECKITKIYGMEFAAGYLCDKPVVVTKCGVGKVNAARCTQYLIDTYKPSAVINTGIGGGIAPGLKVGDAVVADGLVQHDFDVTAFGYAKGYLWTGKDKDKPTVFRPDAKVSDALVKAAESILKGTGVGIHRGIVASGDLFVADPETKKASGITSAPRLPRWKEPPLPMWQHLQMFPLPFSGSSRIPQTDRQHLRSTLSSRKRQSARHRS